MPWNELARSGISISAKVMAFDGNIPADAAEAPFAADGERPLALGGACWRCGMKLTRAEDGAIHGAATFRLEAGREPCGNAAVSFAFTGWSAENYVLLPAAAYNGNRFRCVPANYPPFIHEEDGIGADMPVTITDVPRLNAFDGPSGIHLRSGDLATPCVGVWFPSRKLGLLLLFEHVTARGYTGVRLTEAEDRTAATIDIEAPAVRRELYTMGNSRSPSDDAGAAFAAGDAVELRFRAVVFACGDIPALFHAYLRHRGDICGSRGLAHGLPFSAAYRIIERKYNESQFNEKYGYYMLSPGGQGWVFGDWQAGWCGGGMNSLALLYDGGPLSRERANRTMDAVFGPLQNRNGFILPIFSAGRPLGDDFCHQDRTGVCLIRKQADALAFAARHILLLRRRGEAVPSRWLEGLERLADAFVRLWARHGQFGQFVDIDTQEMLIGGTAAGSLAPGGLALASSALGDGRFMEPAAASARYYIENYVNQGLLNGGPGEILQCPDSESASNMLESLVVLHDLTGSAEWLAAAQTAAAICATWCVSYDFVFPADSAFGRLGMHTAGSVFANVQNKHSAPGFCTLSGASLLRLYRATGNPLYLELCRETAHNITQYLSREDRPIPAWDGGALAPGWMCERVNMSDWEGKRNVGGVFNGSCWCEISCMLTYAEIPGVWFLRDSGEAVAFDHVNVSVADAGSHWRLTVANPTDFDADVKVLAERRADFGTPWDQCVGDACRVISVKTHSSGTVLVEKEYCMEIPFIDCRTDTTIWVSNEQERQNEEQTESGRSQRQRGENTE